MCEGFVSRQEPCTVKRDSVSHQQGPRNRLNRATGATPLKPHLAKRAGILRQQGPRNRLCQTAGAAAPSGGREPHEVRSVGAISSAFLVPAASGAQQAV